MGELSNSPKKGLIILENSPIQSPQRGYLSEIRPLLGYIFEK